MFVKQNIYFKREYPEDEKMNRSKKLCRESETEFDDKFFQKYKTYEIMDMTTFFKEVITDEIDLKESG